MQIIVVCIYFNFRFENKPVIKNINKRKSNLILYGEANRDRVDK